MSAEESRIAGSLPMASDPLQQEELDDARAVLRGMGVADLDRLTVGAAIGVAMCALVRRHGAYMDQFGRELADRGVPEARINEAAQEAGMALLRRSWGGDRS